MTTCGCALAPAVVPRTRVTTYAGAATRVVAAGVSIAALYGPLVGGSIQNPATTQEQGIAPLQPGPPVVVTKRLGALNTYAPNARIPIGVTALVTKSYDVVRYGPPEILYVSLLGPAALSETGGTQQLLPGQSFAVPANWPGNVWVNAATAGHRFAAVVVQPVTQYPPTPYEGAFPPPGPSGLTRTIPSYLYKQYEDDDDLQELVAAYNDRQQAYVDWFNDVELPVYTGLSGALLDWVGEGLYGVARPTLYSGRYRSVGPLNTYAADTTAPNALRRVGKFTDVAATSDDVYKRIITWHVYKGDGRQMTIAWLKRRVYRFLFGTNGTDAVGDTGQISVVFDGRGDLSLTIVTGRRRVTGGAIPNRMALNTIPPDALRTAVVARRAAPPLAVIMKEAVDDGALEMPGQHVVTCRIGIVGSPT